MHRKKTRCCIYQRTLCRRMRDIWMSSSKYFSSYSRIGGERPAHRLCIESHCMIAYVNILFAWIEFLIESVTTRHWRATMFLNFFFFFRIFTFQLRIVQQSLVGQFFFVGIQIFNQKLAALQYLYLKFLITLIMTISDKGSNTQTTTYW